MSTKKSVILRQHRPLSMLRRPQKSAVKVERPADRRPFRNCSKLKCIFWDSPAIDATKQYLAIGVQFLLDESCFWGSTTTGDLLQQQAIREWKFLHRLYNVLWVARTKDGTVRLKNIATTHSLPLHAIFYAKDRRAIAVDYRPAMFRADTKQLSQNGRRPTLRIIRGLNCKPTEDNVLCWVPIGAQAVYYAECSSGLSTVISLVRFLRGRSNETAALAQTMTSTNQNFQQNYDSNYNSFGHSLHNLPNCKIQKTEYKERHLNSNKTVRLERGKNRKAINTTLSQISNIASVTVSKLSSIWSQLGELEIKGDSERNETFQQSQEQGWSYPQTYKRNLINQLTTGLGKGYTFEGGYSITYMVGDLFKRNHKELERRYNLERQQEQQPPLSQTNQRGQSVAVVSNRSDSKQKIYGHSLSRNSPKSMRGDKFGSSLNSGQFLKSSGQFLKNGKNSKGTQQNGCSPSTDISLFRSLINGCTFYMWSATQ